MDAALDRPYCYNRTKKKQPEHAASVAASGFSTQLNAVISTRRRTCASRTSTIFKLLVTGTIQRSPELSLQMRLEVMETACLHSFTVIIDLEPYTVKYSSTYIRGFSRTENSFGAQKNQVLHAEVPWFEVLFRRRNRTFRLWGIITIIVHPWRLGFFWSGSGAAYNVLPCPLLCNACD